MTTLWGATCNPMDSILEREFFFDVEVDEWLLADNMGAYSLVLACGFNGFGFPRVHYITSVAGSSMVRRVLENAPLCGGYGSLFETAFRVL